MSVKIIDFNLREAQNGKQFYSLTLQGGVEIVKSSNGSSYLTIRKASMPTTFEEATCMSLIGTELPGIIDKVDCEPYEYVIPQTGEVILLSHRYEYKEEAVTKDVDFTKIYTPSANGHHIAQTA